MGSESSSTSSVKKNISPDCSALFSQFMKHGFSKMVKEMDQFASFATTGVFAGNISQFRFNGSGVWIVDTGASSHLCLEKHLLHDIVHLHQPIVIHLPNGASLKVFQVGKAFINDDLILQNVFLFHLSK